ncbi:MAG: hypothetical protein EI684_08515 [Candidatus Viridilinea halotolerans]|uniref:Uncharacterized protein n=1 Tax=Candidatus Viridilinea halotolerans TaxID=2491704 RepID=A0A426U267_9CHLR|nr:MAG: hypothetical protein EI684_08515 [Candidatus Viridilinea halotolerans]
MIRLAHIDLPPDIVKKLHGYQQAVNKGATYADRVALAKRHFGLRNRKDNKTFEAVKHSLTEMCSGARRCCYCEDSVADEVEHIKPKDLYPELVFVWENYLYACGPCNGPKNNCFAIFAADDGQMVEVGRTRDTLALPPTRGEPVLIDPRQEDPLDYMELDLPGTFLFLPVGEPGTLSHQRAEYTIKLLGLNRRDYLLKARAEAYCSYRARLAEYVHRRDAGATPADLERLISGVRRMNHPTVWREMQRQHTIIPELRDLFDATPEALFW